MSKTKAIDITERVKGYDDACAIQGITPLTQEQFNFLPEQHREAFFSLHKIVTVIDALNEGHVADWSDNDEEKYCPWFDLEVYEGVPGSGFSYADYVYGLSFTGVGARLYVRTAEHAKYVGTLMLEDYRKWMKK